MGESEKIKVFISYATEDYDTAKKLYDDLKNAGADPWLDREDLLPGQNWRTTIPQIIRDSRYFLLLISSNSVSAQGFIQKEQKIALEQLDEFSANDIFIIPVRLDNTELIDEKLRSLHWADLANYESGLRQIIRVFTPDLSDQDIEQKVSEIDFINRCRYLQLLTSIYAEYYFLIAAPMGYGKTKLIEDVKSELKSKKLMYIDINLLANKDYPIRDILTRKMLSKLPDEFCKKSTRCL